MRIQDDEHGRLGIAGVDLAGALGRRRDPPATDHGSGRRRRRRGRPDGSPSLSLVRGPWEVRLVRVDALASAAERGSRCASAAGRSPATRRRRTSTAAQPSSSTERLRSSIRSVARRRHGRDRIASRREPARRRTPSFPGIDHPVAAGAWVAALVELSGAPAAATHDVSVSLDERDGATTVTATWPDGLVTMSRLADPGPA